MDNTVFFVPEPQTDAEHQNALEQMLAAMQQMNQQMQTDQAQIERLKAESAVLRQDILAIKARTQARLDALTTMVAR